MRSYHSHLATLTRKTDRAVFEKPIFRSSAIFPVIHNHLMYTRLLFMGYWLLKRGIEQLSWVTTLRNEMGEVIYRAQELISEPRAFRVEVKELLQKAEFDVSERFSGSIEVEFYSSVALVLPFPAVVLNIYGEGFSTLVHTAQRVYNDYDDLKLNSETDVPEAGFNIYADENREPFLSFINGPVTQEKAALHLKVYNSEGNTLEKTFDFGSFSPYQTIFFYPAREMDLARFLQGKPGTAKAKFHVNWAYPRLIVGNVQNQPPAAVITHTYYDCSSTQKSTDYWKSQEPGWNAAALLVPLISKDEQFTNIYFYPIYSPSTFAIDLEVYDQNGKKLKKIEDVFQSSFAFQKLPLKELCKKYKIEPNAPLSARILAREIEGPIPARIKIGLDVGESDCLPCNICTNLQPFNPELEKKPHTFRWAPLLDTLWVMNSSPAKEYQRSAEVILTFYREQDNETISKTVTIPPHGFQIIRRSDAAAFFKEDIGWVTATSTNPYVITYYFALSASGIVAGDHGF